MVVTAGPVPTTLLHEMNENEMLTNAIAVKINRVIINTIFWFIVIRQRSIGIPLFVIFFILLADGGLLQVIASLCFIAFLFRD